MWSAGTIEIRDLLRAPTAEAVERGRRTPPLQRSPRSGRTRRSARHRLCVGGRAPLSRRVLAFLRARGLPRRVQRTVAPSGSATASACYRPATTRRPASQSGSPPSTSSRTAASTSAPENPRRSRNSVGSAFPPRQKRAMSLEVARADRQHDGDGSLPRVRRGTRSRCRAATWFRSRCQKPHPPIWIACSNRETIKLAARLGIGALRVRVHRPGRGEAPGSTSTTRSSRATSAFRSATRSTRTSRW